MKSARFGSMLYAFNGDESTVKTGLKIVLEGPSERVVGLHCIGPSSDEMLQGFAVAIRMGECLFYWEGGWRYNFYANACLWGCVYSLCMFRHLVYSTMSASE